MHNALAATAATLPLATPAHTCPCFPAAPSPCLPARLAAGDIDFSFPAYKAVTGSWPNRLTIQWEFSDCSDQISGGIHLDPKDGINAQWQVGLGAGGWGLGPAAAGHGPLVARGVRVPVGWAGLPHHLLLWFHLALPFP